MNDCPVCVEREELLIEYEGELEEKNAYILELTNRIRDLECNHVWVDAGFGPSCDICGVR